MDSQTLWIFILGYSPALSPTPEWMSSFSPCYLQTCGIRSTITMKSTVTHLNPIRDGWLSSTEVESKWQICTSSLHPIYCLPQAQAPVFVSPSQAANAKSHTAYTILNSPAQFLSGPVFILRAVTCEARVWDGTCSLKKERKSKWGLKRLDRKNKHCKKIQRALQLIKSRNIWEKTSELIFSQSCNYTINT